MASQRFPAGDVQGMLDPVLRVAEFVAMWALVAVALAWLLVAGPAKAVIPAGYGSLGAVVGFAAGVAAFGARNGLLDAPRILLFAWALGGAGFGWLLGAGTGFVFARSLPPVIRARAHALHGIAGVALLSGFVMARFEITLFSPAGFDQRHLRGLQVVTVVDAALVALIVVIGTLATPKRFRGDPATWPEGPEMIGRLGLYVACLAAAAVFLVAATQSPFAPA